MRIDPVRAMFESSINFLARQGEILADRVKKSGVTLSGEDLLSYKACLDGAPTSSDLSRLRELLARIGK